MFDVQNPKKMFSAQDGLHPSGYPQLFIYLCICLYIYLSIFHIYILLRPGALCCPEIYRDVPGMLIMMMMMMSLTGVGELNPY